MFDIHSIAKRQIEILGLALSPQEEVGRDTVDLAIFFGVDEITIKRDLRELRSLGIPIHSVKKKGICLDAGPGSGDVASIILQYAGLCYSQNHVLDKPTALLVTKSGAKSLSNITLLQVCADRNLKAEIRYNIEGKKAYSVKIMPLLIFQNEGSWRVLAQDGARVKQFLLEKILDVKVTREKFEKVKEISEDNLFGNTWKTWIGSKNIQVKLHMNKLWADRIKPRLLIANQKITPQDDGSIIFEASVNSLDEIAGWIVCRGHGIKVLEPRELRDKVIEIAEGVLNNYRA